MRRREDKPSPEEIRQMRNMMEQLRNDVRESKAKVRQVYEEMRRRYPEYWKAFGFEREEDYLWHFDLQNLIPPRP